MLLSYCAGDGILLPFSILHIFCCKAEFFSISLENTCMVLFYLRGERFREFHLSLVGFLFLVCNSLYICLLFSCLMVPELFWQTPHLGGGRKVGVKVWLPREEGWIQQEEGTHLACPRQPRRSSGFQQL